jgi:hypothetical protein
MIELILVQGDTGTGKTRSLFSLNPQKTLIINADDRTLQFKGSEKNYPATRTGSWAKFRDIRESRLPVIIDKFKNAAKNFSIYDNVVIDTISHAMLRSVIDKQTVPGYDKFTLFAREFYDCVMYGKQLPCKYLIIFSHQEFVNVNDEAVERFKVPAGRFTSEKIVPESHFSIVLVSRAMKIGKEIEYVFETRTNGINRAKSPEGMFEQRFIPNDMQYVINCIEAYKAGTKQPEMPVQLKVNDLYEKEDDEL